MLASISLFVLLQLPIESAAILAQVQNAESSPRTEVTSVDLNDGIYVIGSFTSNDKNSDIVEMYIVTSNS